jgi:hypothetical protein
VAYTETCVRKAPLVGGVARKIESYNSVYRLGWQHISEHQKREHLIEVAPRRQ